MMFRRLGSFVMVLPSCFAVVVVVPFLVNGCSVSQLLVHSPVDMNTLQDNAECRGYSQFEFNL